MISKDKEFGVIHATDTPTDMDVDVAMIRQWHLERGFSDIGYALLIKRDGTMEVGRDTDNDGDIFDEIGAHALGYNKKGFGVALAGGYKGKFDFTFHQIKALIFFITEVNSQAPWIKWVGHNEVSDKECPCFDVQEFLKGVLV